MPQLKLLSWTKLIPKSGSQFDEIVAHLKTTSIPGLAAKFGGLRDTFVHHELHPQHKAGPAAVPAGELTETIRKQTLQCTTRQLKSASVNSNDLFDHVFNEFVDPDAFLSDS